MNKIFKYSDGVDKVNIEVEEFRTLCPKIHEIQYVYHLTGKSGKVYCARQRSSSAPRLKARRTSLST